MLDDEMKENQFEWIFNSFLPFMFEGAFYDLVRGRGVDRNIEGLSTGINVINSFFFVTKYLKDEKNIQLLKTYLKYIYEKEQIFYNNSLGIGSLGILEEIILDKSIKTNNIEYNFAKIYSRMDKAIAQINGVGLGISLSSPRTGKYESMNGENKKGWYQGDGMTYIYLSPQDYANSYWPYVNYYRLPGTTVTTAPREEKDMYANNAFSEYYFIGGVYSNNNMVAVMQLESDNPLVYFKSSLVGNKAYFVFENIFVFMGNNIRCDDDYDVETIIENRRLNGKLYFGDKEITEKSGKVTDNYIYIENYGGIYVPDYSNVKYKVTDNGFLEIYFEHGKKITNSSYKYFILPKITRINPY
jgi:hyaluronate lyase